MPKGVEHATDGHPVAGLLPQEPQESLMPKGVEHW